MGSAPVTTFYYDGFDNILFKLPTALPAGATTFRLYGYTTGTGDGSAIDFEYIGFYSANRPI